MTATLALFFLCAAGAARFEYAEVHMGVSVRIVLHAPDEARARAAARAAFDRVRAWDDALSDWRRDSDAMRLPSRAGESALVDGRLAQALDAAQRFTAAGGGAFDPGLGALSAAWREARRRGSAPVAAALAEARAASAPPAWAWDAASRTFTARRDGVRMDFGGVGQGLAADDALRALREAGCPSALVDVSGDIALGDAPPGESGWRVRIEAQFDGQVCEDLLLDRCGVSTSGDRAQRAAVDGRVVSHILDPRTGEPLATPRQATVVARDATTADALATTLCVLDAASAEALAHSMATPTRLDRMPADGGVRALAGWERLRRASPAPEAGSSAPEVPRPSPASEASGPPGSPPRPSR